MIPPAAHSVARPLARPIAAIALAAAGGIHLAVGIGGEGTAAETAFFLSVAAAQGWIAWRLGSSHDRRTALAAIWSSMALIALWAVSRTVGLPMGTHAGTAEAVRAADLLAAGLQVIAIFALIPSANDSAPTPSRRMGAGLVISTLLGAALLAPEHRHHDNATINPKPRVASSHLTNGGHP